MFLLLETAFLILLAAALTDLCWRRIPNVLVAALAVTALLRVVLDRSAAEAGYDIAAALAVFLILLIAWSRSVLGGGDVKFAAAAVLLVGYRHLPDFLILTALCGGGLAILVIADMKIDSFYGRSLGLAFPASGHVRRDLSAAHKPSVPYGIAIAAACLLTLFPLKSIG